MTVLSVCTKSRSGNPSPVSTTTGSRACNTNALTGRNPIPGTSSWSLRTVTCSLIRCVFMWCFPVSRWRLERHAGGEESRAGRAAGQDAAEFDGIELEAGTIGPRTEVITGRSVERERERLAVSTRPVRDDVGDEAPIVMRGQFHRAPDGAADVDSVDPRIPRQD